MQEFLSNLDSYNPIFIDCEFSGPEHWGEVVEIAIVDKHYNILFTSLLRPTVKVFNPYSERIHGLKSLDLKDMPSFEDVEHLISFYLKYNIVISYNSVSDRRLLNQTYTRYNKTIPNSAWICLASIYQEAKRLKKQVKLTRACQELGIEEELPTHLALEGALRTAKLFNKLVGDYGNYGFSST